MNGAARTFRLKGTARKVTLPSASLNARSPTTNPSSTYQKWAGVTRMCSPSLVREQGRCCVLGRADLPPFIKPLLPFSEQSAWSRDEALHLGTLKVSASVLSVSAATSFELLFIYSKREKLQVLRSDWLKVSRVEVTMNTRGSHTGDVNTTRLSDRKVNNAPLAPNTHSRHFCVYEMSLIINIA